MAELADACGVATEFWDWQGRHTLVPAETIRAVLAALEIDAADDDAALAALDRVREQAWRRVLPPVVVLRAGWTPWVSVHVPHGSDLAVTLTCEDGTVRSVPTVDRWVPPRTVDGTEVGEATVELPGDLPLGYHVLRATSAGSTTTCPVIVTPHAVPLPAGLRDRDGADARAWGLMAQLYSVRSRRSWGVGDLADLAELAAWVATSGPGSCWSTRCTPPSRPRR